MSYFKNFDLVEYDFTISTDSSPVVETITDLIQRVQLKISDEDLDKLCERYVIEEGDTPEKISYQLYNTPTLHWTILYINKITNIYAEWPLTESALVQFCREKYGEANLNDTHHFEKMPERLVMDESFILEQIHLGNFETDSLHEVTNLEYEETKNELKRFIRVIAPGRVAGFVDIFVAAMTSQ